MSALRKIGPNFPLKFYNIQLNSQFNSTALLMVNLARINIFLFLVALT